MKATDYKKIVERTEASKNLCQLLGHNWRESELGIDDFKERYFDTLKRLLSVNPEFTGDSDVDTVSDTLFTEVQWNRYKKIYEFHPTFIRYLASTEAGDVHKNVLERIPFRSFYISFGGTILDCGTREGFVPCVGIFVYVYFSKENGRNFVNFAASLRGINDSSVPLYVGMVDGSTFTEVTDIDKMPASVRNYITHNGDPEQTAMVKQRQEDQKQYFMIILNACQYLCASNAEIRDLKISKNDRPVISVGRKRKAVNVQVSEIGYRIGQRFEKMYQDQSDISVSKGGYKGIKKRPHVRRAHWHHYWTGTGRTNLEVRWLEPVFVMGSEEEIDTVVHEVEGGQNAI